MLKIFMRRLYLRRFSGDVACDVSTSVFRLVYMAFVVLLPASCTPWMAVTSDMSGPVGKTNRGVLTNGAELPPKGPGYAFYHSRDRRYGSEQLTSLIEDVALRVESDYPGSILKVGDLSGRGGGKISGHSSHRTGQDVDFAFFVRNPKKKDTRDFVLSLHDQYGVAVAEREVGYFDYEKNWALVEALLTSGKAEVQWIFVSKGLKARLLAYALSSGKDLEVIARAADVLHQPGDSAIHNDHFHVRIYCPPIESSPACRQRKPVWPWIEKSSFAPSGPSPSDDRLVELALENLHDG